MSNIHVFSVLFLALSGLAHCFSNSEKLASSGYNSYERYRERSCIHSVRSKLCFACNPRLSLTEIYFVSVLQSSRSNIIIKV